MRAPTQLPPDDLLAPDAIRDPQNFFRRLREYDPVFWSPRHQVFVLTRHAEVDRAFKDKTLSSARAMASFRDKLGQRHAEVLSRAMTLLDGWMLLNDPPSHTRLRAPVRRTFSPAVVNALEPMIDRRVTELLDEFDSTVDVVSQFAQPLTARVICDLLGVEVSECEFLRQWTRDFGKLIYGASAHSPDYAAVVGRAGDEFYAHLRPVIEQKRSAPGSDLISHLLRAAETADWTEAELLGGISMLLFAGHDTTSALLASSVRALLSHPAARAEFATNAAPVDTAIEEFLRFDGPSKNFVRVTTATHERGGHVIEAGQPLWLSIMGANHDPDVFDAPDELRLDRTPNPHVSFGGGIHFCVGAALARAEARVALPRLFARFPQLKLATQDFEWSPTIVDRTLLALPIKT